MPSFDSKDLEIYIRFLTSELNEGTIVYLIYLFSHLARAKITNYSGDFACQNVEFFQLKFLKLLNEDIRS